ncbi:glutathione peroxidase, partial [Serratia marcescens]|uniref:glutathione peroxidase n=2 Tax=Serratia TaxID=613 RepID=UPI001F5CEED8
ERGLVVLGFPCNQFGSQEPGSPLEIANFCSLNYGVSFPLFSKIDVNGPGAHPLFNELKHLAPGILGSRRIKWNFTKFLLTADGQRVTRFAPITKPERLFDRIETLLK